MLHSKNFQEIPDEIQQLFLPYLNKLLNIHNDNILSIFIYGSATGVNYKHGISDINSCFVFREIDFSVLQKSLKIVYNGQRKKITVPLFLTKLYMESSLDIFPIEFLDMKENYILLYGEDILSSLKIKGEHIRLFCEQQIKGKLIRIRQAYLEVGLKKEGIKILLKDSLNSLMPIFRNLIKLKHQQPSANKEDVIRQLCQIFQLKEEVFLIVYQDVIQNGKSGNQDITFVLSEYIDEIRKLAVAIDQL